MKASEIYLDAARQLAERESDYSCVAIMEATSDDGEDSVHCAPYLSLFAPTNDEYFCSWSDNPETRLQLAYGWGQESRDHRTLALCFMAAIAEDEERPSKRSRR